MEKRGNKMKLLFRFMKPFKKQMIVLLFLGILTYIGPLVTPMLIKVLVDDVFTKKKW
jgi:ABC-type multidrug transport system fused ATPase/permease subunit